MMPPLPQIEADATSVMDQARGLSDYFAGIRDSLNPSFLIGLAIALAILFAATWMLQRLIHSAGTQRGSGPIDTAKEARRLQRRGEFLQAGEMFEMAGELDQAIEMYQKADAPRQLGHVYETRKNWSAAAAAYQAARDADRAAQMFQRAGQYQRAAEIFESAGKESIAAELYEKAKDMPNAARLFERTGHYQKAATAYERIQKFAKAAELYEKFYLQEMTRLNGPATIPTADQKKQVAGYAQTSGRLYAKVNEPAKAAKILMLGGFALEAAQAYAALGDSAKAAELYLGAKQYHKAAEIYRAAGNHHKASLVEAEMHLESHSYSSAAESFEQAEDFLQAAELFERAGLLKRAGSMFLKAGDFNRANEIFQTTGDLDQAAAALERAGQPQAAAQLYGKMGQYEHAAELLGTAGDFYQAGVLWQKLGRLEDTIALLQKVETQSPDYVPASVLLGKLFMDRGMLDAAKERYKKLINRRELGPDNLEPYYNLALIYERGQEYQNALLLYEKIVAENYNFKDVQARLVQVKEALKRARPVEGRAAADSGAKNRYRLQRKIGQGGMGVVFLAEDTVLNRTVAYKVLPPSVKDNPRVLENFLQEARAAAAINHPNIVTIYDTGAEADEPYIIMEYVDGLTLKEILEKIPRLANKDILRIGRQICTGLDYAHSKHVIHRDIKPANIMVSREQVVKIMDFGLAKILTGTLQEGTSVKGTPLYMSPEQIRGTAVDHRTDIYSLGCTLYRMATGRPPFIDGDVYYHHLNTAPQPPKTLNPQLPDLVNALILKAMEKDPARRYQRAKEIGTELESLG